MNTNLLHVTAKQLRRAAKIKDRITGLEHELALIVNGATNGHANGNSEHKTGRRRMSAAARHRISLGAKRRWRKARKLGKTNL